MSHRPTWQLPPGVSAGTWDYLDSELVAVDYDDYFTQHTLFQVDQQRPKLVLVCLVELAEAQGQVQLQPKVDS